MKDKVILIAGGSGGIGSETAKLCAKAGAKIVLAARNRDMADEIAGEINSNGGEAFAIDYEATDMSSVYGMVETVVKEFGKIDVLVNAFGIGMIQPLLDANPDEIKSILDVNVYGTIITTQAVLRHMATAKSGKIINIPGILGKHVMKNSSVYSASKFAVTGFTKALVEEHRRSNVSFSLLYLGGVATDFWENPNIEMRVQKDKMISSQAVAKAIYYTITQPEGSVLNELVIQPDSHQMV